MKKRFLLLLPIVLGLASCCNKPDTPTEDKESLPNQVTVDKVKDLLNKQDLSEFYSKTLNGTYTQEYDVLDISHDEDTTLTNEFRYSGSGFYGFYYDLTSEQYDSIVDENGNIDIFDTIKEGTGYYGIVQNGRSTSSEKEGDSEAKTQNLSVLQQLTLKSIDENVWLYNTLDVTDEGPFNADYTQVFNSLINKELLFGSLSTRSLKEIISQVNLFDAPGNIEHLDRLFLSICRELVSKNDKEISDFLIENQVSINETDDIELSFVFANEDLDEEELDYIFPGEIKGTLFFDKNTYQFSEYNYEISYKDETCDEESGDVKSINMSFSCSGQSSRELPHDAIDPINPTVYDDVAEFLKDINEQVVPPNIYL